MKKILVALAIAYLSLTSCAVDYFTNMSLREEVEGQPLYYGDFSTIKTRKDIVPYIRRHVVYRHEKVNNTATPEETLTRGYGDCEDFAVLYMNILYVVFNEESYIAYVDSKDKRTIVEGGYINHTIVQLQDGTLIEPQLGVVVDYPVGYRFHFWTVFNRPS